MGKIRYNIHCAIASLLFLLLLGPAVAAPRAAGAAEEGEMDLFDKAYESYLDYHPDIAASAFGSFAGRFRRSSARDAALYWQAKALLLTGRDAEAKEIFGRVRSEYPTSPFADFARRELETPPVAGQWRREHEGGEKKEEYPARAGGAGCENALRKSEASMKEMEEGLAGVSGKERSLRDDLAKAAAELSATKKERDEAVAALREAELKLPEVNDVAIRLREREKFQKEQDEYIKKLKEEKAGLAEEVRQRDTKLSDTERTIALLKSRTGGGPEEKKAADGAESLKLRKAIEEKDRRIEELTVAARERDNALAGKDELLKQSAGRQSACEEKTKELEAATTEVKRLRDAYEKSKAELPRRDEGRRAEEAVSRRGPGKQASGAAPKDPSETGPENGLKDGEAPLKKRLAQLDAPAVAIAGKTYSMREIDEESRTAARVLSKTGFSASWRRGDAFDDFVAGRALAARATKDDRTQASAQMQEYAKKYPLTDEEKRSLALLLTAENVIRRREAEKLPDEEVLKKYYEDHKEDYLVQKEERFVKYLVMKYRKTDRLGSVALVSELQREAGKGKKLEEIARPHAGSVALRRAKMEDLPAWIAEKIRVLKDGEISSIFTEDQFIMLRMRVRSPVYRTYEDAKDEIAKRLSPRAAAPADLDSWLAGLRKEAVEVK